MYYKNAVVGLAALAATTAITPTATLAQAASPTMENLGLLSGYPQSNPSRAFDVSGDGNIIIGMGPSPFTWDATNLMQALPGSTNYLQVEASATNLDGSIVVGRGLSSSYWYRAIRWTPTGGVQDLGALGGIASEARDVNADGTVVVGIAEVPLGSLLPFRWVQGIGMTALPLNNSNGGQSANGVNAAGNVVVGTANYGGLLRAVRWVVGPNGTTLENLGVTTGLFNSYASAVNAAGNVVVGTKIINRTTFENRAFVWDSASGITVLPTLGGISVAANDVSADGSKVVGSSTLTAQLGAVRHAFVWDATNGMTDLGTLTQAGSSEATAISDAGDVIVGWSEVVPGGFTRAFVYRTSMLDLVNTQTAIGDSAAQQASIVSGINALMGFRLGRELEIRSGQPSEISFSSKGDGTRPPMVVRIDAGLSGNGIGDRSASGGVSAAVGLGNSLVAGAFVQITDTPLASGAISMTGTQTGYGAYLRSRPTGNSGLTWKVGAAANSGTMDITRAATLTNTEAGQGRAALNTVVGSFEVGYGMPLGAGNMTPFLRVTSGSTTRAGYTEQANINFPVTYDPFTQSETVASIGIDGSLPLGGRNTLRFGVGVETDLARSANPITGTSAVPGMNAFSLAAPAVINPARGFASVGLGHVFANNSEISIDANVGQDPFSAGLNYNIALGYQMQF